MNESKNEDAASLETVEVAIGAVVDTTAAMFAILCDRLDKLGVMSGREFYESMIAFRKSDLQATLEGKLPLHTQVMDRFFTVMAWQFGGSDETKPPKPKLTLIPGDKK
jgi:hypothetical protein